MINLYLLSAFGFVWLVFFLYAWNLSRRQARLREELENLKKKIETQLSPSHTSNP